MPVYKDRKRGTWYVKYSRTVNGKREQVFKRGFATKKEAVLWESTETANNVSHTSMTFEDLFKEQLKFINSSETSSSMKKSWLIKHFPYYTEQISKITKPKLIEWRNSLDGKLATRTINRGLAYVRAVFSYASTVYNVPDNGRILQSYKLTKEDKEEMPVWTVEQFSKFLDAVKYSDYKAYFYYLFWSGCRRSEGLALCKEDIDGNRVRIHRAIKHFKNGFIPLKSDSSERTILLDDVTLAYLKPFIDKANPFVFGETRSLPITSVQKVFEKAIEESGVPRIRIHDLRHSHATMLINSGANIVAVSKRLGHSDINITLKVYSHLLKRTEEQLADTLAGLHEKTVSHDTASPDKRRSSMPENS